MLTKLAALALVGCLVVVAGCSQDEPAGPPPTIGADDASSAAPSEEATPSAPADPAGGFDDEGNEAFLTAEAAQPVPAKQEVVDAWLAYWKVRLAAFGGPELDPAALGEVASGKAAEQVISYVRYLEDKKLRTQGDLRLGVERLRVTKDRARLTSCADNLSVDVRSNGKPAEALKPFYTIGGTLERVEGQAWVVTDVVRLGIGPCRA